MSHQLKLSLLFVLLMIVQQSTATLGLFGLGGLNTLSGLNAGMNRFGGSAGLGVGGGLFPATRINRSPETAQTESWPSSVRIVDLVDLPKLLFSRPNLTDAFSSGSLWSRIFNIFNNSPDETINDEMDKQGVAWFAIPGYNQVLSNPQSMGQSILPGLLVPAKVTMDQLNQTLSRFNPLTNFTHFTNMFPLFNLDSSSFNQNPFNLPLIPLPEMPSPSAPEPEVEPEQNSSPVDPLKVAPPQA